MKLFDIDWQDFIQRLGVWQQLSLAARRALAGLRPDHGLPVAALEGHVRLLAEADFIELHSAGRLVRLAKTCYPFGRAIRAMVRHDLLSGASDESLLVYLRDHFTSEELRSLSSHLHYGYESEHFLVPEVRSVSWVERFLAEPVQKQGPPVRRTELPGWLRAPGQACQPAPDPEVTKRLVRHLMELPGPVPFAELQGRWPDLPPSSLGAAIRQGIEQLVFFPAMREKDMTPMLSLWPAIHVYLHRPRPHVPKPIEPQDAFHGAFLVEDMTTALVAAAAQPLRLRGNDSALFAKAQRDLEASLMSVPDWILRAVIGPDGLRIAMALDWLRALGFARRVGIPGEDLRLQSTRKGSAWLAQDAKGRLKAVLDHFRASRNESARPMLVVRDEDEDDPEIYDEYPRALDFFPFAIRTSRGERHEAELCRAVAAAMETVPRETFVPLVEFLDWHVREANPLPKLFGGSDRPTVCLNWSDRPATVEEIEQLWGQSLLTVLLMRLVPLGGARLGVIDAAGNMCFALTGAGRYLLGLDEDFDYGLEHDAAAQLVVQPNFDVVFLSPSPLGEAAVARFAERKGRGVGALFAITKKSILSAAGSGMTGAQVLDSLRQLSAKPVPANVEREITGWFDQCRRIMVRSALLVHCPDADTAARVVAAAPEHAVLLTETAVELSDPHEKSDLLRKLRSLGIFAENDASRGEQRRAGSRGTGRRRTRSR